MNIDQAKQTVRVAEFASAMLNIQLLELQKELSKSEFSSVTKGFGVAMGELFCELIDPIYKQYPELAPPVFGGTAEKIPDNELLEAFELITRQSNKDA